MATAPTAGYSGTPLATKLGIKAGSTVALLAAPDEVVEQISATLPGDVRVRTRATGTAEVIVSFHTHRADLERRVERLLAVLEVDGGLWLAWPKRASGVTTDITEDTIREVFLPLGLVDNKVCAINATWSGLRVVWRKELRAGRRALAADGAP